jgi:hypothetical protein
VPTFTLFTGAGVAFFDAAPADLLAVAPLEAPLLLVVGAAFVEVWGSVLGAAAAPAPGTVTTWTAGLASLVLESVPERPISTPIPMASNSVPMPAMIVLLTDARERRNRRRELGALDTRCSRWTFAAVNGSRGAPQRCPHSTQ